MRCYRDGFGYEYRVPDECVDEFERRLGVALRIKIAMQVLLVAGLLYLAWFC
jgi:hypothetical protein